ncbi:hypothetical protein PR048_005651 [Dryococelus australis]|uniref:PiggyBac transposable element-derived protein domain-containing protein n=1 Tax=Dryococelus australis TaxID=614101 RepID=A0ABQ9I8T1_9NEOP|nr:hypothetical protein PR048_005651 [Dryococelus australis]
MLKFLGIIGYVGLVKSPEKYGSLYTPGEIACVYESNTFPWMLSFQAVLASQGSQREKEKGGPVPTEIVKEISENLLDKGRTIVTDNCCTSVDLAKSLLARKTHFLGTVRKNRRDLPKGSPKENNDGILVLKWKDKRDVLVLLTKYGDKIGQVKTKRGIVAKPKAIVDYNEGKAPIDLSDQMIRVKELVYRVFLLRDRFYFENSVSSPGIGRLSRVFTQYRSSPLTTIVTSPSTHPFLSAGNSSRRVPEEWKRDAVSLPQDPSPSCPKGEEGRMRGKEHREFITKVGCSWSRPRCFLKQIQYSRPRGTRRHLFHISASPRRTPQLITNSHKTSPRVAAGHTEEGKKRASGKKIFPLSRRGLNINYTQHPWFIKTTSPCPLFITTPYLPPSPLDTHHYAYSSVMGISA